MANDTVIGKCTEADFGDILEIVNDAAEAYRGIIPADRWNDPYLPEDELRHEIDDGVVFWGLKVDGRLAGVMGLYHFAKRITDAPNLVVRLT